MLLGTHLQVSDSSAHKNVHKGFSKIHTACPPAGLPESEERAGALCRERAVGCAHLAQFPHNECGLMPGGHLLEV